MLDALVRDGTITLIALGALALELAVVAALALSRGKTPSGSIIANALSGLFLILALRAALLGQASAIVAIFLALGGAAHLGDLALRRREGG